MEPLHTVLLGFLAIIFVPAVGLLACREILRTYGFIETDAEANRYAFFAGGASVLSAIPAAAIISQLPTRTQLVYTGPAETPYQNAWYYTDFPANVQAALDTAIAKGGSTPLPESATLPAEFVMMDLNEAYEFTVVTDVILLGYPLDEFSVFLILMTLSTMFWGLLTLSYLIFWRDEGTVDDDDASGGEETKTSDSEDGGDEKGIDN